MRATVRRGVTSTIFAVATGLVVIGIGVAVTSGAADVTGVVAGRAITAVGIFGGSIYVGFTARRRRAKG